MDKEKAHGRICCALGRCILMKGFLDDDLAEKPGHALFGLVISGQKMTARTVQKTVRTECI
jgi:hypothetical protein